MRRVGGALALVGRSVDEKETTMRRRRTGVWRENRSCQGGQPLRGVGLARREDWIK